jgi:hypothetical protein
VIPRCRWEDFTKTDLEEIGREGLDRINLAQGRAKWRTHKHKVMTLQVP